MHIDKLELDCNSGRKIRRVSQPEPLKLSTQQQQSSPIHQNNEKINNDCVVGTNDSNINLDDENAPGIPFSTGNKLNENIDTHHIPLTPNQQQTQPGSRNTERLRVRNNGDGTYSASWTPNTVGCYSILVDIDGYQLEEVSFLSRVVEKLHSHSL